MGVGRRRVEQVCGLMGEVLQQLDAVAVRVSNLSPVQESGHDPRARGGREPAGGTLVLANEQRVGDEVDIIRCEHELEDAQAFRDPGNASDRGHEEVRVQQECLRCWRRRHSAPRP